MQKEMVKLPLNGACGRDKRNPSLGLWEVVED